MVTSRGALRYIFPIALLSSALALLLILSACGVAERTSAAPTPAEVVEPAVTTPANTAAPEATTIPMSSNPATGTPVVTTRHLTSVATISLSGATTPPAWQSYRSDQAGYTVEYPKDWTVDEQTSTNGASRSIVTTFRLAGSDPLIIVTTLMQAPNQAEPQDMPNARCQQAPGNRGIAARCLDTVSLTTSTTIASQGKTYTIVSAGKGMDQSIYQHMLDSFTPFATPASQAGADLEPLLFRPDDLPDGIAANHSDNPSPINFEDNPPAATMVGLTFTKSGRGAGSVSVLRYTAPTDLTSAFTRLTGSVLSDEATAGNTHQPKPGVGEQAIAARLSLASSTYGKDTVSVLIFTRCRALVDIRLNEWAGMTMEAATAYAQALDKRLTSKACP